jgi:hypothetical protein
MRVRVLAAVAVFALAVASPLAAQPRHRGRRGGGGSPYVDREGFLIGFSVGAGVIGPDPCKDCGVAFAGELHLGAMASYYGDVAVMLEAGGLGRENLHHAFLAAAAQWWPDPWERFWLRGGVGIGSEGADDEDHKDSAYPTVLAATGFEVVRSERFTVDLQAQGVVTFGPHRTGRSLSVNVGFNWY